ncbi:hypothetical protein IHE45_17G046900 [Dioscorea alata]|uniref:Uncharacterized protein n=1 Tax=Dioscorea alata TaxID=55571 RepID=A0ACB7UC43_DIOAL|nr:hypothetical protein IHE45_17G046900 [Dioscorea alata]
MQRVAASFSSAALRQLAVASVLRRPAPSPSILARSIFVSSAALFPHFDLLPIYRASALDLHRGYARGRQVPMASEDEDSDSEMDDEFEDGDPAEFAGMDDYDDDSDQGRDSKSKDDSE